MKLLVITPIVLFFFLFILIIPMKMQQEKFADLLQQEIILKDSVRLMEHNLALEMQIVDSLRSRERIEEFARPLGFGMYEPATKIVRYAK